MTKVMFVLSSVVAQRTVIFLYIFICSGVCSARVSAMFEMWPRVVDVLWDGFFRAGWWVFFYRCRLFEFDALENIFDSCWNIFRLYIYCSRAMKKMMDRYGMVFRSYRCCNRLCTKIMCILYNLHWINQRFQLFLQLNFYCSNLSLY